MTPAFESDLAWSTPDEIFVKGRRLTDLLGTIDLGDMLFLLLTGREPSSDESRMTNALLVALVEHGMTPSALAARLTWLGAPESTQAAVASGLLGVGSRFVGSVDEVARVLQETLTGREVPEAALGVDDIEAYLEDGRAIVAEFRSRGQPLPGIGHPIHKPEDPRTTKLFSLARELKMAGPHVLLQQAIRQAANEAWGRHFPINATGAIGSILSDMGFPWQVARGFPVISRCVGLVGHLHEELNRPMARTLWTETEKQTERP